MTQDNVGNKGENDRGEAYKSSRDVIEDPTSVQFSMLSKLIIQHHAPDSPYLCSLNGNQSNRGGDTMPRSTNNLQSVQLLPAQSAAAEEWRQVHVLSKYRQMEEEDNGESEEQFGNGGPLGQEP